MDMSKYRELFLSEAREHINGLSQLVVTLEQEPGNRETIDALFREAHSIKGMAATMGFNNTARLSHHLEDLLDGPCLAEDMVALPSCSRAPQSGLSGSLRVEGRSFGSPGASKAPFPSTSTKIGFEKAKGTKPG